MLLRSENLDQSNQALRHLNPMDITAIIIKVFEYIFARMIGKAGGFERLEYRYLLLKMS
jgi:hypothetical protein